MGRLVGAAFVLIALAAGACSESARSDPSGAGQRYTIAGATMGTTFNVTVVASPGSAAAGLRAAVERRLDGIEGRMSHYRPDSELSRFNRARTTEPLAMSRETLDVVAEALAVSRVSGGAFDVTVGPLVDAWGFGSGGRAAATPDEAALAALRARIGFELLQVDLAASTLRKRREDVALDLSAIAKGYAVDAVATLLDELGFSDYLVEIGGELRAAGANERGEPWRVAIERPAPGRRGGAADPALDGRCHRHVR